MSYYFLLMLSKLRQQTTRFRYTNSNRLSLRRARQYLLNFFRLLRRKRPSAPLRGAGGILL